MGGKRLVLDQHEIDSVIYRLGKVTGSFWHVQDGYVKGKLHKAPTFYSNGPSLSENWNENDRNLISKKLKSMGINHRCTKMDNWVHTFDGALGSKSVYSIYVTAFQAWKCMESDAVRKAISLHII